jgi:hypothetical protein
VGGVGECNRVGLEKSDAVSRPKNTREAECLGEDTRLVCITGMFKVPLILRATGVCKASGGVGTEAFTRFLRQVEDTDARR